MTALGTALAVIVVLVLTPVALFMVGVLGTVDGLRDSYLERAKSRSLAIDLHDALLKDDWERCMQCEKALPTRVVTYHATADHRCCDDCTAELILTGPVMACLPIDLPQAAAIRAVLAAKGQVTP